MAETIAERRARLAREMEQLEREENSKRDKIIKRAEARVEAAIDKAAEDIVEAARTLDGDDIDAEEVKRQLRARYNIDATDSDASTDDDTDATVAGEGAEVESGGVERDTSSAESPPADDETAAPPPHVDNEEDEEVEEEEVERDERPPVSHWASKPLFGGKK